MWSNYKRMLVELINFPFPLSILSGGASEVLKLFGVEAIEIQPVEDVQDPLIVVLPAELGDLVQESDQSPVEAHVEPNRREKGEIIREYSKIIQRLKCHFMLHETSEV